MSIDPIHRLVQWPGVAHRHQPNGQNTALPETTPWQGGFARAFFPKFYIAGHCPDRNLRFHYSKIRATCSRLEMPFEQLTNASN